MLDNGVKHIVNYSYVLNIYPSIQNFVSARYGALAYKSRMAAFCAKKVVRTGFFGAALVLANRLNPLFATLSYLTTGI